MKLGIIKTTLVLAMAIAFAGSQAGDALASSGHLSYISQPLALQAGFSGQGTYVAVLDSGLDHQRYAEFGSCPQVGAPTCKVYASYEIAPQDNMLDDSTGHGSRVAATILKVAPGAKIIAYDVRDHVTGGISDANVRTALEHLRNLKSQGLNVVAANMSFGSGTAYASSDCSGSSSLYAQAFDALRAAGILPVTTSGNSGGGGSGAFGVGMPGCLASALTVGATYDANVGQKSSLPGMPSCTDQTTAADKVACFSQTGPALDILAPGSEIPLTNLQNGNNELSTGTSFAAPHVAGAVALLASARPSATAAQIESALLNAGPTVSDQRYSTTITRPRLDINAAVGTLLNSGGGTADTTAPNVSVPQVQLGAQSDTTVPGTISWSASDPSGISAYELWVSIDNAAYTKDNSITTQTSKTYGLNIGTTYRFAVRAKDGAGNWSGFQYSQPVTVVVEDRTAPTVSAPLEQFDSPNPITAATVPVKLTWTGSDASGISAYELWVSTNNASYVKDATVTTQTSKSYLLEIGKTYRFAVRAKDGAGNWSGFQYGNPLTVAVQDEKTMTGVGSWSRYSWASAYGGTALSSSQANASIEFTFSGRDIALVAPKFPTGGRAKLYCDGYYMGLADLYAAGTTGMNTVAWCRFAQSTTHTIKLVLEGTSGRPRFDVDAFAILR